MTVVDRLFKYLKYKNLNARNFEQACKVANGYLKKQQKGKGSIGSDIIERIHKQYFDLNILWLLSGKGDMLGEDPNANNTKAEEHAPLYTTEEKIKLLSERISMLEAALADKEKIIALLEAEIVNSKFKSKN